MKASFIITLCLSVLLCNTLFANNIDEKNLLKTLDDTVKIEFKIAAIFSTDWATIYKTHSIKIERKDILLAKDSMILRISFDEKIKTRGNMHHLKLDSVYVGKFVKLKKYIKTAHPYAGTTGIIDMSGKLWHLQSIRLKNQNKEMKTITITGTAYNAKLGAIVKTENDEIYYLERVDSWPDNILEKKVQVSGTIASEYFDGKNLKDENGIYTQGMIGEKQSIKNAKWSLIEE